MKKVFITGITGFVGSHLADYLLKQGIEVHGLTRWRSPKDNILHCLDDIVLHHGDLLSLPYLLKFLLISTQCFYDRQSIFRIS